MAASIFEKVYPNENKFIIFTNNKKLTHSADINADIYKRYYLLFPCLIRKVISGDIVIFHGMNNDNLKILSSLPASVKVVWIGWGYDYYDLIGVPLLKNKSKALEMKLRKEKTFHVRFFLKNVLRKILYFKIDKRKVTDKVNVFSPVLYEDYLLIKKELPCFKPKYSAWNYGTLEDDHIRGFENKLITGNNVLIGNSASITNNHLESFELVKQLELRKRKVIVPLSYGSFNYREIIIKKGKEELGGSFQPLTEFLAIDEYIAILQSCSIVIMNHLRQQALGNIVIALYMGAKVFLDKRNPIYTFFANQGVYIYCLEDLSEECEGKLSIEQISYNREVLKKHWSRSVIFEKTKSLIEQVINT